MNYFIVDTSFQMLCAIEAREAMAKGQINRLFIEARGADEGRALNLEQILALNDGAWSSIDISKFPRYPGAKRSIVRLTNLLRLRIRYGKADLCFAGTFREKWVRRIARILSNGRLVRLDDGISSLPAIKTLRSAGSPITTHPLAFSMFHNLNDGPSIAANTFSNLRGKAISAEIDSELGWIIGGAYSESGIMPEAREIAIISKLIQASGRKRILYCPHRADLPQKLDLVKRLGIEVADLGPTFEMRLLQSSVRPAWIGGIASTALLMSRLLMPNLTVAAIRLQSPMTGTLNAFEEQAQVMGIVLIPEESGTSAAQ